MAGLSWSFALRHQFYYPYIVSKGKMKLIGNIIEDKMGLGNVITTDYPVGSLLSIIILIAVMGSLWLISKIDAEGRRCYE